MKAEITLPKYVIKKQLPNGRIAYYYNVPTWARKKAEEDGTMCPVENEALGSNIMYVIEKASINNNLLDSWRKDEKTEVLAKDTIDGLIQWYRCHPKFVGLQEVTKKQYRRALERLSILMLPNAKKKLGTALAARISMKHADMIYDIVRENSGNESLRQANIFMAVYRRMWALAIRADVCGIKMNPFERMGIEGTGGEGAVRPATFEEILRYIESADALHYHEMGDACLIAFELLQRVSHIQTVLKWTDYVPNRSIRVEHPKTGARVDFPLTMKKEKLFPELEERLSKRERRGELIVMAISKAGFAPYNDWTFRRVHKQICAHAELPDDLKFSCFRKGGFTVLGNASATDSEIMSLSGHRSRNMISVYTKKTSEQIVSAVRKRREYLFNNVDEMTDD